MSYGAVVELGVEVGGTPFSDDATSQIFLTSQYGLLFELMDEGFAFADFTIESSLETENGARSRVSSIELDQIGLIYAWDEARLQLGKIYLPFGLVNSDAPGYFGDNFVQDYDLDESIGLSVAFALERGTLTTSVFALGEELSDGAASADFAVHYDVVQDDTAFHLGLRTISEDGGRPLRETGIVVGAVSALQENIGVISEVAAFQHWEGSDRHAIFGTLGANFEWDEVDYNALYTIRRIGAQPHHHLISLGLGWEIYESTELLIGFGKELSADGNDSVIGMSIAREFGN